MHVYHCLSTHIYQTPLNLKYSSSSWKFVRIRVKSSSCLKIVQIFLHNFSGLSLFLALPHHVMGSEAILASTWANSITKHLSGIAIWAEHLEKRSRPFQKQIILWMWTWNTPASLYLAVMCRRVSLVFISMAPALRTTWTWLKAGHGWTLRYLFGSSYGARKKLLQFFGCCS